MVGFGELVMIEVKTVVVVDLISRIGVAAIIWLVIVSVLISVVVLAFGVEVNKDVSLKSIVLTWETVFGVLVTCKMSEVRTVEYFVTGSGVTEVEAVIFDVTSLVEVNVEPRIVNVVETISFKVIVVDVGSGRTVANEVVVMSCVTYL